VLSVPTELLKWYGWQPFQVWDRVEWCLLLLRPARVNRAGTQRARCLIVRTTLPSTWTANIEAVIYAHDPSGITG
jgi:hypothetical protein